jgi:hypothetical protein
MGRVYILNGVPFLPVEQGRELAEESIRDLVQAKFSLSQYAQRLYNGDEVEVFGIFIPRAELVTPQIMGETNYNVTESDECYFYIDNEIDNWMEELDSGYFNLGDVIDTDGKYDYEYECIETEKDWTNDELELLSKLNETITAEMLEQGE